MRAIRNMEPAWVKVCGRNFALTSRTTAQPNGGMRKVPCYLLTKTECLYIATKFNDEARARLVIRWQQLERERMMREGIKQLPVTEEQVKLEAERIIGREITAFNKHADGCVTASDVAQALGLTVKELNAFLTDRKVQKWVSGQYRLMPEYEGLGLAKDRLFVYYSTNGRQKERTYLVWTAKGAKMIEGMMFVKEVKES